MDASLVTIMMGVTCLSCACFRTSAGRIQHSLVEQLDRIGVALRATGAGTVEWEITTGTQTFSDRLKEILGYDASQAMPTQDIFDYVHPEDRTEIRQSVSIQLEEAFGKALFRMRPCDFRLVHRTGASVWVHAEAYVLGNDTGATWVVCTVLDISDAVRIKDALDTAHRRLQRQAQRSSEQAGAVARALQLRQEVELLVRRSPHKKLMDAEAWLRKVSAESVDYASPLSALQYRPAENAAVSAGAVDLLIERRNASDAVQAIGEVISITESMVTFFDFRAMEEGRFRCELVDVDLASLVNAIIAKLRERAQGKCIDLVASDAADFPLIKGHARLCSLCLESAVSHALELSPVGTRVALRPYTAGRAGLTIEADFYLEPARLSALLGPGQMNAWQIERVPTMHEARLGLQAMGGHLVVTSSSAHGTRFGFELLPASPLETVLIHPKSCAMLNAETRETQPGTRDVSGARCASLVPAELAAEMPSLEHGSPTFPVAVLLATDDPLTRSHFLARFAALFESSAALPLDEAIDAFMNKRFDVVALCPTLDTEARGLMRQMKHMQRAAFEDQSMFIALLPSSPMLDPNCPADFERVLHLPLQSSALIELARTVEARRAAAALSPWVESEIVEAFPDYLTSRKQLVGKLSTALRAAEHANARVIAHTLVGSPGLHGFDAALAICKEIESQAEGARADPAVLNAVEQLGTMFDSALVR